jgi:hypothetical protein
MSFNILISRRAPAGRNEPQRKSVQQWKLLAVHGERDHHLAVAGVIDGERLQKFRRARHHRLVQAAEADLNGARFYAGTVKHVLETHTGPDRVAHRTVGPLSAGNARFGVEPRSAGALVDRGDIYSRQALQNILERQRKRLIDLAAHRQTIAIHIDVARKIRPVPADIMLLVWGEHAFVEDVEGRLKPWRARTLQDHSTLCGWDVVIVLVLGPPATCRSNVCCADAREDISARLAIPIPPARRRVVGPVVARHYPASATLSCTLAVRQDKVRRVRFDDSRLCWIDPMRGSLSPGDRTACKTVGRTVFTNVGPACEAPVRVLSQSPHFLK